MQIGLLSALSAVHLSALAGAQELHGVSNDIDGLPLGAVLRLPLAPVLAPVDGHATVLGEVLSAVLALSAPDGHVEVVRLVDPLVVFATPAVDGYSKAADGRASRSRAKLWIAGEVAGDDDAVDVGGCYWFFFRKTSRNSKAELGSNSTLALGGRTKESAKSRC